MTQSNLVGIAEIAEMYGVPKSTVNYWTRHASFPEPALRLKMGPAWNVEDVEVWRTPPAGVRTLAYRVECPHCGDAWLDLTDIPNELRCQGCTRTSRIILTESSANSPGVDIRIIKETA